MVSKSPKKVSDGAADEDQAKRAKIYKINSDATLTADEKTRLIQQILGGGRCIPQPISLQGMAPPLVFKSVQVCVTQHCHLFQKQNVNIVLLLCLFATFRVSRPLGQAAGGCAKEYYLSYLQRACEKAHYGM